MYEVDDNQLTISERRPYTKCIAQFVTKKAVPNHDILGCLEYADETKTRYSPLTSTNVPTDHRSSGTDTRLIQKADKQSSPDTKVYQQ